MWSCCKQSNSPSVLAGKLGTTAPLCGTVLVTGSWLRWWLATAPCPKVHRMTPGMWPVQELWDGVWPDARGTLGVGRSCSPPIRAPLPLLTSCLFLSSCRLTGAWSYWCHCHRLPPGYICACGLGCHHTEKVLGLLNSIKHFSVTQLACLQPSTAPELSAWGPGRNGAKDTGKALQALCWAARLHQVLIALGVCLYPGWHRPGRACQPHSGAACGSVLL